MAGRGWAWTAYDFDEQRLFNYVGDAQNTFPIWNAAPLVALDVYEHAYFLDYQTDRASYIEEAFIRNLRLGRRQRLGRRVRAIQSPTQSSSPRATSSAACRGALAAAAVAWSRHPHPGGGNPGATNVWRTLGFKFGIAVTLSSTSARAPPRRSWASGSAATSWACSPGLRP